MPYTRNKRHLENNTKERGVSHSSRKGIPSVCPIPNQPIPEPPPRNETKHQTCICGPPTIICISQRYPPVAIAFHAHQKLIPDAGLVWDPFPPATDKFSVWLISYTSVDSSGRVLVPGLEQSLSCSKCGALENGASECSKGLSVWWRVVVNKTIPIKLILVRGVRCLGDRFTIGDGYVPVWNVLSIKCGSCWWQLPSSMYLETLF